MTKEEYADLLLKTNHDYKYYENVYKPRNLDEKAMVTRYAPSPTGLVHLGALYASFISKKLANQSNGVFFLRIEDTDQKRSIENGMEKIIEDLAKFDITFDEGVTLNGEKGSYGPYIQSQRKDIYKAFAKKLIIEDKAYPCFCQEDALKEDRERQEKHKERIGYYGFYARCRNLTQEQVIKKINDGEKYIIRLKSKGNFNHKFEFKDEIKGKMELPENDQDIVIIKSDGLPTYHFAHAVDDHLMGTTHVVRGDEWLSSVPVHVQLFEYLDFKLPKFAHIAPIMIDDSGTKRKLSKRKDPWAAISYYHEQGIPNKAVMLYLETIANSNFEMWLNQNKDKNVNEFILDFKKMPVGGTLFDYEKLMNISKNYISTLKANEVYELSLQHAKTYDTNFALLLEKYKDYSIKIFNIEREQKKPRKDIGYFSDVKNQIWYMYDELFIPESYEWQKITDKKEIIAALTTYLNIYDEKDDKDTWFNKMKQAAIECGYAGEMKEYKENPDNYKGSIADFSTIIRVSLTSKHNTPDLFEIMKLLGKERINKRIQKLFK
ncbi:MAG: glutamate--tRNA ligase [Bacilli bacterium]|nr:glutamate--tRNA ligase [Bacilli bacterium]